MSVRDASSFCRGVAESAAAGRRCGRMFVFEHQCENDAHHECIGGEDEPCGAPVAQQVGLFAHGRPGAEAIDDCACGQRADRGADAVGHQHEKSLGRALNRAVGLALHEQCSRDVEEVERHAVDHHRTDEHPQSAAGIAQSEQPEAEHPGEHGDEHHLLDAEAFEEEGDEQDAERFGDLRKGGEGRGVVGADGAGEFGGSLEASDEGGGVAVGDLERDAQQHGEDEEEGHLALLEECESLQAEHLGEALLSGVAVGHGTCGQGEGVDCQREAQHGADEELHVGVLEARGGVGAESQPALGGDVGEIDEPHGGDEAHGAPDADGREVANRVVAVARKDGEGHRVGERDGGHVEGDAQRVEREEGGEGEPFGMGISVVPGCEHERSGQCVAQSQQLLGGNVFVGNHAQDGGHEDGDHALYGVEPCDAVAQSGGTQVVAQAGEVGTPHGELEKIHEGQSNFYIHKSLNVRFLSGMPVFTPEKGKTKIRFFLKKSLHGKKYCLKFVPRLGMKRNRD